MALRITPQITVQQLLQSSAKHSSDIAKLQQQISSGLRITKPSDDPLGTKTILSREALLGQYDAQGRTLNTAKDRLNQANTELLSVGDLLVQARDIASQARTSLDDTERASYASEINTILTQVKDTANAQLDGEFLFGGDTSNTQPYPDNNGVTQYAGSSANLSVSFFGKSKLDVIYSGQKIFQSSSRGTTYISGNTGAKVGKGTDTATLNTQLTVTHTATTFASGSGVAAGSSSVAADTLLGPAGANVLTITDTSGTGAAGTISLNGGAPVAFTNADTDLVVTGPNGELIHLDTTAITAGFSGNIDVTSTGTLSADGGVTQTAIDFASNAQAIPTADGRTTFIDSTGIRKSGSNEIEYAGVSDVFQSLADLRDELLNKRNLSPSDWQDAITRRVDEITRHHDHVLEVVGSQAQTLKTIDDLDSRLSDLTLDAKQRLSDVAATDVPSSALALQEAQNLLQYSYAVTSQVFKTSLLDYLA